MAVLLLILLAVSAVLPQEQWRLVQKDGTVATAHGSPRLDEKQRAQVVAGWVWTERMAPRRVTPEQIGRERFVPDKSRLSVVVTRRKEGKPTADLRLFAAPTAMWLEVPEGELPSWPVPKEGRLSIPVDSAGRPWRLRVAGHGEGSWWVDVPPGQLSVPLTAAPATDIDLTVVDAGGKPVGSLNGSLQEPTSRGGAVHCWERLRGDKGRFEETGLPDEAELSLTLVAQGAAPLVVRGRPSALPHRVQIARGAEVVGKLVDEQRRPVAGAAVAVESFVASELPQLVQARTRSDTKGEWHLGGLPAGKVAWSAKLAGFVPIAEMVDLQAGTRADVGVRALARGGKVAVQVVDDLGAAVPGARVKASAQSEATADSAGIARLSGLPIAPVELTGSAGRHLDGRALANPPFLTMPRLVLGRAFTVEGRFVDSTGAPVLAGSVRVDSGVCRQDGSIDAGGRFELDLAPDVRAGELVLHSSATQELRVPLAAGKAGEVRDLGDLKAPNGITVTGQVVRSEDGGPVAGARIWTPRQGHDGPAVAWAAHDLLQAVADSQGHFQLAGLLPGPAVLRVEAANFARAQVALDGSESSAQGEPGAAIDLGTVTLSAGATLHVHVGRADGGAEGAIARADLGDRWLEPDLLTAQVWDGEAILQNVPAGKVTVSVLAGRKLLCEHLVNVLAGGDQEVDCRRPSVTVSGVVRVGGVPVRSGTLLWQAPSLDVPSRIDTTVSPSGLKQSQVVGSGRPPVDVAVGPDGSFSSDELVPGSWQVTWIDQGSMSPPISVSIPEVERFATVLPFAGSVVTGTVTDRDGQPAEQARVRELTTGALAFTAADGSFSLSGLPPGKIVVQAQKEETTSPATSLELRPDQPPEPLQLVLGPHEEPSVAVQVFDAQGVPVAGAVAFLDEEGKGPRILTTGGDGTVQATLSIPLPARVRAAAFSGEGWVFGDWTDREAAAQQGLLLQLPETGSMVVRSAKLQGAPSVTTEGGWDLSWLLRLLGAPPAISAEHPLQLMGLPSGRYEVRLGEASIGVVVSGKTPAPASLDP